MDSNELRRITAGAIKRKAEEKRIAEQARIQKFQEERQKEADKEWERAREAVKNLSSTLGRVAEDGQRCEVVFITHGNLNAEFHPDVGLLTEFFHLRRLRRTEGRGVYKPYSGTYYIYDIPDYVRYVYDECAKLGLDTTLKFSSRYSNLRVIVCW